jgi:Microtubule associated protein 1A/1B, light chain 3.
MFSRFVKTNEKIDYNILEKIKEKYPDKVPVIVREIHPDLELSRRKYLVPKDITYGQLLYTIRSKMRNLQSSEALYLLAGKKYTFVPITQTIGSTFDEYNENGFILLTVTKESTFG